MKFLATFPEIQRLLMQEKNPGKNKALMLVKDEKSLDNIYARMNITLLFPAHILISIYNNLSGVNY